VTSSPASTGIAGTGIGIGIGVTFVLELIFVSVLGGCGCCMLYPGPGIQGCNFKYTRLVLLFAAWFAVSVCCYNVQRTTNNEQNNDQRTTNNEQRTTKVQRSTFNAMVQRT
jgi:hypothetical protein